MAGRLTYSGRSGELRLYDNSGLGTPNYLKIPFVNMDFTGPVGQPRPLDPVLPTVGGYVHAPTSSDYERGFYEGQSLSFSCWVDDQTNRVKLLDALCNTRQLNPWTVAGTAWSTTKGKGSVIMPDGNYFGTQPFHDLHKVTVDVEVLWNEDRLASALGMSYGECYFPPQDIQLVEAPDIIELRAAGVAYGNIGVITAFTAGKSVDG